MKQTRLFAIVLLVASAAASCTVTMPISAMGPIGGPRTGKASATQVLGMWVTGDASIATAAKAGGIDTVRTVDMRVTSLLGIVRNYTTVVTGK